jgi:hypothetical protein
MTITGVDTEAGGHALAGRVLPEGEYTITRAANDAVLRASGAVASCRDEPHPVFASIATLAGTGLPIDALLGLAGSRAEDGPMLGEIRIERHRALRFDLRYRITRRVLSYERKRSRRLGAMDVMRFVASLHDADGLAAAVTYTWILPQRGLP